MTHFSNFVVFTILLAYFSAALDLELLAPQNYSTYAISSSLSSTSASLRYKVRGLLPSSISAEVCVQITSAHNGDELLALTCFPAIDGITKKILDGLTLGSYFVHLTLQESTKNDATMSDVRITSVIDVKELKDVVPRFALNKFSREVGLESSGPKIDFTVKCPLRGVESAMNLVEVCAEVNLVKNLVANDNSGRISKDKQSDERNKLIMGLTCIPKGKRSFVLGGVTEGVYDIRLILRLSSQPFTLFKESEIHLNLDARPFVEMLPTYQWQQLHAWHTIPMGLQTR